MNLADNEALAEGREEMNLANEMPGSCEDCIHIDLAYLDLGVCTLLGQGMRLPREGRLKNCPLEAKWQS